MRSKTMGKKVLTNKGGRQTMKMKKIMAMLIAAVMLMVTGVQVFADYSNYGYNSNYGNYGYNNTNYGYIQGPYQYNVDSYVENSMRNNYSVTSRYYSGIATRYEAVKHYMAFYNNNGYNTNYNYGYNNGYNTNYNYGYNNGYNMGYGYSNLQQFADYNMVSSNYSAEDLQIMQQAVQIGLLRGIEENGYVYLAPSNNLRRCEYAAFTNRAMQLMNVQIYGSYQVYNFNDVPNWHWAYQDILSVCSRGIMSGYSNWTFGVDDTFRSQDALITYYRIFCEESGRFDTETFRNVVNSVGYFWLEVSNRDGSRFELEDLSPMKVGDSYSIRVYTDLSGYSASKASWSSSNLNVATVRNGKVTAVGVGTATITASYKGYSDSIIVTVTGNGGYNPVTPSGDTLAFNESEITIQKGSTENLDNHLVTRLSGVSYSTQYTQYINIVNGNCVYGVQATNSVAYEVIARYGNQTATIRVKVTDNNKQQTLAGVKVTYGAYNEVAQSLNVTVTGLPAGYSVKANDGFYSVDEYMNTHVDVKIANSNGIAQLNIHGLYEADGRDSVIINVYDASGQQVWEDPNGAYCPQLNGYIKNLNF